MEQARILVVEDEKIVSLEIQDRLSMMGYTVPGSASFGEDAIKKAGELRPDLVLMDIKLKGEMDGIEAAEQIRTQFGIPVIYLTAYADVYTLQRAKITEPYGYLLKPFEEKELHTIIEMALYRSKIERQLKENRQWLSTVLKSIGDAVIATDETGRITFMNPVAEKLTGWKSDEAVGNPLHQVFSLVHEKNGAAIDRPEKQVIEEENVVLFSDMMLVNASGDRLPVDVTGSPLRNEQNEVTGAVLSFEDISGRRLAEKAIRENEKKYRTLFNHIVDPVFIVDFETFRFLDCNQSVEKLYGYTRDEIFNMTPFDLHPVDEREIVRQRLETNSFPRIIPYTHVCKSGKRIHVEIHSNEFEYQGKKALVSIVRDVTERRRVMEALLVKDSAINSSINAIIMADLYGRLTYVNPSFLKLWGIFSEDDIIGHAASELWAQPEELNNYIEMLLNPAEGDASQEPSSSFVSELTGKKRDGSTFDVQLSVSLVLDHDGKPVCLMGSMLDITERKRARREIDRLREFNESLVQNMAEGIAVENDDGEFTFVNPAAARLLGYPIEELLSMNWKDVFPKDQYPIVAQADEDRKEGKSSRYEAEMIKKDGTRFPALISGSPRYENGQFKGTFAVFSDVSEMKRAEQEIEKRKKFLQSVLDGAPDAIVTLDCKHEIIEWNPGAEKVFGYTRDEVLGKDIDELITGPDQQNEALSITNRMLSGKRQDPVETVRFRKDGMPVNVIVAGSPIFVGDEMLGVVGVYTDITRQKQSEEELKKAKELAEAMNMELKLAIERANQMAVDAEMASVTKSEFLANMSHEIRTPMNGIIGMTELTLETELSDLQREYLEAVKSSADSLLTIINDILDFSKIEAGRLDMESIPFSLNDLIQSAIQPLALRANQKGLELAFQMHSDVPDEVIGDPSRVKQVLLNLMSNAVKFTNQGEVYLDIDVKSMQQREAVLQFSVFDTGIGIPGEKQNVIFDAFTQADGSTTRKYGGTGLGLAICSKLVQMMRGKIWVESPWNQSGEKPGGPGSLFRFTVTFDLPRVATEKKRPAELADLQEMPVLIVDDNATNLRILNDMLSGWGMKPTLAQSGPEALQILSHHQKIKTPFALMLLDVNMPEMDGITLATKIQTTGSASAGAVMMLSSFDRKGDLDRCRQAGIETCLTKPVSQRDLLKVILDTVGVKKSTKVLTPGVGDGASENRVRPVLNILLAEDNAINRKLAVTLLSKRNWNVTAVVDGSEALQAYKTGTFDVVLMDIQMPTMDGMKATAAIRELEAQNGHHIPIVAMTAHAMKGDRERCLAGGMDDYVSKPMKANELYSVIEKHVWGNSDMNTSRDMSENYSLDLSSAMEAVDGDVDLLKELIKIFVAEYPDQLGSIRTLIEKEDFEAISREAHSIKGAVGNFGAQNAFELAFQLEKLEGDDLKARAQELLEKLENEVVGLSEYLLSDSWEKEL